MTYIFQIPTIVITPGGQPLTGMALSICNYSGHILKLVPGDHNYELPQFSIVITWNGKDKFCPTQCTKPNHLADWKLGIMDRHLTEAMKLFEEVEGNLYNSEDPTVLNSLHDLRRQTHLTKQILGDRMKGQKHLIPPVLFQARKATTSDMTYPVPEGYVALPLINPDIDVDFGATVPPQPTPTPQATQEQFTPQIFVGFQPPPAWSKAVQDFILPVEIPMSITYVGYQQSRIIPPPSQILTQTQSDVSSQITQSTQQTQQSITVPETPSSLQLPPPQVSSQAIVITETPPSIPPSQSTIGSSFEIPSYQVPSVQKVSTTAIVHSSASSIDPLLLTQSSTSTPQLSSQSSIDPLVITPSSTAIASSESSQSQLSFPVSIPLPSQTRPPLSARKSAPSATVTSSSVPPAQAPSSSSSTPSQPPAPSVKKHKCRFCPYSTDRKNDWQNHCNVHTGTRFKCGSCDKDFASEKNRTIHFKQKHLKQHRAICPVDRCNFSCNDFGILRVHNFDVHGIGTEARCSSCNKKFGNYRVYQKHIQTCQVPKDKDCPVCGKSYKDTERLANHMDTNHKGVPKKVCEHCGKIFSSKDSLRVHQASQHS